MMTSRRCLAAFGVAACLALMAPPPASASIFGDAGRFVKKTTKKVGRAAGSAVKDVGRATGKAAKATAKATGKVVDGAATLALRTTGKGVKAVGHAGHEVLVKAAKTPGLGAIVVPTYDSANALKEEITGEGPKSRRALRRALRQGECYPARC
jgi:hypothetical protein